MTVDFSVLWRPRRDQIVNSQMYRFRQEADYQHLWRWSVDNKEEFWSQVWGFCGVIGDKGKTVYQPGKRMQDGRFFPDSKLNFAENLLRRRDGATAMVFKGEGCVERLLKIGAAAGKVFGQIHHRLGFDFITIARIHVECLQRRVG